MGTPTNNTLNQNQSANFMKPLGVSPGGTGSSFAQGTIKGDVLTLPPDGIQRGANYMAPGPQFAGAGNGNSAGGWNTPGQAAARNGSLTPKTSDFMEPWRSNWIAGNSAATGQGQKVGAGSGGATNSADYAQLLMQSQSTIKSANGASMTGVTTPGQRKQAGNNTPPLAQSPSAQVKSVMVSKTGINPGYQNAPNKAGNTLASAGKLLLNDAAGFGLGVAGDVEGVLRVPFVAADGIAHKNMNKVTGAFTSALVPKWGWYSGPGWGRETVGNLGIKPLNSPTDKAAFVHDETYYDKDNAPLNNHGAYQANPLLYPSDSKRPANQPKDAPNGLKEQADWMLRQNAAKGQAGPLENIYRWGLDKMFKIRSGEPPTNFVPSAIPSPYKNKAEIPKAYRQ